MTRPSGWNAVEAVHLRRDRFSVVWPAISQEQEAALIDVSPAA